MTVHVEIPVMQLKSFHLHLGFQTLQWIVLDTYRRFGTIRHRYKCLFDLLSLNNSHWTDLSPAETIGRWIYVNLYIWEALIDHFRRNCYLLCLHMILSIWKPGTWVNTIPALGIRLRTLQNIDHRVSEDINRHDLKCSITLLLQWSVK